MNDKNQNGLLIQILPISVGCVLIPCAIVGIFAIIGKFNWTVITGAALGAVAAFLNQLLLIISVGMVFDKAAKERGSEEMTEEQVAAFTDKYKKRLNASIKLSYLIRLPLLGAAVLCAVLIPSVFHTIAFIAALVAEQLIIILSGLISKKPARK